jgi:hypothetical protein
MAAAVMISLPNFEPATTLTVSTVLLAAFLIVSTAPVTTLVTLRVTLLTTLPTALTTELMMHS